MYQTKPSGPYPDTGPLMGQGVDHSHMQRSGVNLQQWNEQCKERQKIQSIKYFLFAYNLCIFIVGGTVLGIGIWMAVDRSYMTYIIDTDLYSVVIYMTLLGGGFVFFVSFLGCCGAITENRCLLMGFCGVLCVLAAMLVIGGIIGIAFSAQIGDKVKTAMEDTLKTHYGVDFHKKFNRQVTNAWDRAQEKLECCAVTDVGWSVWQDSAWFDIQPWNPEDQKPFVPQSCCVKDRFWRFVNLEVCQKWRLGPPGSPVDGAVNDAIYYNGCFDQGVRYMRENAGVMYGLGICLALLLGLGIALSFFLIRYEDSYNEKYHVDT